MPVDISSVLHVLAHELRTPSGIAQGYLRMLLDDRLTEPTDRRRALEQAQKALARVSELTHESTQLANWLETPHDGAASAIDAHALLTRVIANANIEPRIDAQLAIEPAEARVLTTDGDALATALATWVKVTARELRNQPCTLIARITAHHALEVLIGTNEQLASLGDGPNAPAATPIALERGGIGLSLVYAAAVLDAHRAAQWTLDGERITVGIRIPLEERALP